MDKIIWLFLAVFTVYRLAQLIAYDSGPFNIFRKLRVKLRTYDVNDQGLPVSSWGELAGCPYCLGMYLPLLVIPLLFFHTIIGDLFLIWFGVAGMQTFLQTFSERH